MRGSARVQATRHTRKILSFLLRQIDLPDKLNKGKLEGGIPSLGRSVSGPSLNHPADACLVRRGGRGASS
jgi:hypothetical protein